MFEPSNAGFLTKKLLALYKPDKERSAGSTPASQMRRLFVYSPCLKLGADIATDEIANDRSRLVLSSRILWPGTATRNN